MKTASPLAGAGGGGDAEGHTSTSSWRGCKARSDGQLVSSFKLCSCLNFHLLCLIQPESDKKSEVLSIDGFL